MSDDIDKANYADLKTLEDRVRRTLFAHGFNEKTSTPLGDMNSLCRNLVQDAAATDAELAALQARLAEAEAQRAVLVGSIENMLHIMARRGRLDDGDWSKPINQMRQALANQPPSDLVALVKALCAALATSPENYAVLRAKAALDTLLTNQPGFRTLIDREDV